MAASRDTHNFLLVLDDGIGGVYGTVEKLADETTLSLSQ